MSRTKPSTGVDSRTEVPAVDYPTRDSIETMGSSIVWVILERSLSFSSTDTGPRVFLRDTS